MGIAQAATAFPLRLLPLLAPVLLVKAGTPVSTIGYLSSVAMLGAMAGALATGALCARLGLRRSLQLAMAVATVAALLHGLPTVLAFAIASLLAGLADGLTPAAGNSLLQRAASVREQQRLFALKMIGGPLGGLTVGLVLPRVASDSSTWRAPLVAASVTIAVGALLAASRGRWLDESRRDGATGGAARTARTGLAFLARVSHLRRIAALGFLLAFSHGVWYAYFVVFLATEGRVPLMVAGTLMSVALGVGILTRLTLGLVAHRIARPDQLLGALCLGSAVPWFALSGFDTRDGLWPGVLIAAAFGATLGGWLGVQQAEISRCTPLEHVDRVGGAAAFLMFLALTLSGVCFALLHDALGGSRPGFRLLGAVAMLAGIVPLLDRSAAPSAPGHPGCSKTTRMQ
jgi:predicted MFS family arabinose efflux permease